MSIEAAKLRVVVGADTSGAESDLKSFGSGLKNVAGNLMGVGGVLTAAVSAPILGIGTAAVMTAATFEKSMNVLGYVSGATADQMQAMSDQAMQLGADTVFSANEAAAGMVELAKAGMETEDVMGAIPGVMDLAAAGGIDVAEAAGLAAATINTFGLEAEKTTEVADILAAAANASSADIRDLAFGVQNAGSIFASSGQSVETLATMMALLANNGLNASDAATSLKTMTLRLTAPTDVAAGVMKDLGLAVYDADGNMREYADILADMELITKDMSDAQRNAAFNTIFGADAIRAATILIKEGSEGYDAMNEAVNEQGAAAAMAQAQNSGLAGSIEQIKGSLESLGTKIALPFLDEMAAGLGIVTGWVNQMGELPEPVIKAGLAFAAFAASIGLVTLAAGGILSAITVLSTPVGLVALAFLGLAAAVALAWVAWDQNWGDIQGKLTPVTEAVTALITEVQAIGTALTTAFTQADIPTFDELFADVLAGDFSGLATKLQEALDRLVLNLKIQFQIDQKMQENAAQAQKNIEVAGEVAGAVPAKIAASMTTAIEEHDWGGDGFRMGAWMKAQLVAGVNRAQETDKQSAFEQNFEALFPWAKLAQAFNTSFDQAFDPGKVTAKLAEMGTAIQQGIADWVGNFMKVMMPSPSQTSTADILREQTDGFSWDVPVLNWSDYITLLGDWGVFITQVSWESFIPSMLWETFVDELGWSDWIPRLDWGRFVSWLNLPTSGGGGGSNIGGGGSNSDRPLVDPSNPIPGFASGTSYWRGGRVWVGEHGPELIDLPRGSQIYDNNESMEMASGPTIVIQNVHINNGMDIEVLAAQLARRFQQKMRTA